MKQFKDTIMYKKGSIGEEIFDKRIKEKGIFVSYAPNIDGSHPFDRLIASKNKKKIMAVDIKAISRRDKYPDTGISIKHYHEYKHLHKNYGIEFYIVFVDNKESRIYGNTLNELDKSIELIHNGKKIKYPIIQSNFSAIGKQIIYFPLQNMKHIDYLTDEEKKLLDKSSNYNYKIDMNTRLGYEDWKSASSNY